MFSKINLIYILPCLIALMVLSFNASKPFIGHHDFVGAMQGSIAKNYLKYGFLTLKFGQTPDPIRDPNGEISFYTNYLPLMPVLITFSYMLFGVNEFAIRIIPIILSCIGLTFFILITEHLYGKKAALIGSIFYIFNPMFIYFGKLPAAEIGVLTMVLATIYFYLLWTYKHKKKYLWVMFTAILIGGLFGWPIVYIGPLIILHSLLTMKFTKELLIVILATILIPAIQFFHIFILYGELSIKNFEPIRNRLSSNSLSFGGTDFTYFNYLKQQVSWLQAYYTRVALILSAITLLTMFKKNIKFSIVLLLLVFGLMHPIIFSQYVFVHDFLNIYLLPFIALSASLSLVRILSLKGYVGWRALVVIIILTLFLVERIKFTQTLLLTSSNKQGRDIALLLNTLQTKDNQAVIVSERFQSFYGVFTNFYSNYRYKIMEEKDLHILDKTIKYLIFFDEDIVNKDLYLKLTSENNYKKNNDLTIIYLNE